MKKILFVITKSNWGGAQRYVFDLASSLPKDEFEVLVAFGGTGERGAEEGELAKRLREAGVRTHFINAFARDIHLFSDIRAFFELVALFLKERPAVVHLNSSKAGGVGALAARIAGIKKIIFTVHGLPGDEARSIFSRALIRFATSITFFFCTDLIAIAKNNASRMPVKKTHLIYPGIASAPLLSRPEARAAALPPEIPARHEDELWALTIAELHPNKNIGAAIDSVTRFNDSHPHTKKIFYTVIGEGQAREALEADILQRRMREHIALPGFVPDAWRVLPGFDFFLLPSWKEGLPYVLLEAGQASLPVIASTVGGIPELVEDGVNGFVVPPGDSELLARRIEEVASSGELRERLGKALENTVRLHFSLEHMLAETTALYRAG